MSHEYQSFPGAGQPEGAPGQAPPQNGPAPGQGGEPGNGQPMQYPVQDGPMMQGAAGADGKTTLW